MKKLTKNNLARMATLLPELNAEHQRGILGGTAVVIGTPDYTEMIPVPTVVTSTVDLYAMTESIAIPVSTAPVPTTTVSPVVSTMPVPTVTMAPVETSAPVSMKTVSPVETVTVPMDKSLVSIKDGGLAEMSTAEIMTGKTIYSWEKMVDMLNNGSWCGGMVDGMGYVGEQTTIFSPSNFGTGAYYTFSEYMRSIETNYGEHFLNTITGCVPILGDISVYGMGAINSVLQKLSGDLLEAGYVANSPIYTDIYQNFEDKSFVYRVWDARTGTLVSSRSINSLGYYKK